LQQRDEIAWRLELERPSVRRVIESQPRGVQRVALELDRP
jgi:hypothetical protein